MERASSRSAFNFCVTSNALRDYFFAAKGLATEAQTTPYFLTWAALPTMRAATEIANLSKHFQLHKPAKTKGLASSTSPVHKVFVNSMGDTHIEQHEHPDVRVILSDGSRHDLYSFTTAVLAYWRGFLRDEGIRVRSQTVEQLLGVGENR